MLAESNFAQIDGCDYAVELRGVAAGGGGGCCLLSLQSSIDVCV